jgi:hypothetical protein
MAEKESKDEFNAERSWHTGCDKENVTEKQKQK